MFNFIALTRISFQKLFPKGRINIYLRFENNKLLTSLNEKVSILGCGWYGLPLSERLVNEGYIVKGSSTRISKLGEIALSGAIPFHIALTVGMEEPRIDDFFRCDSLIVTIPPPRMQGVDDWHLLIHRMIVDRAIKNGVKKVVLISSTSVYPKNLDLAREEDAAYIESAHSKVKMLAIEDCYKNKAFSTLILRPGGLIGPDRHPAKFLSSANVISDGKSKVNMIHRDDLIGATIHLLKHQLTGEFNICAPNHPTREDFYKAAFESVGKVSPASDGMKSSTREVSSEKLIATGFTFRNGNLMHWLLDD
ncbi:MAG: NAD-dependent epimerase/dehydratase family protein [Cryomorphaceae bacterium]|nr:NAD-dependent epimerase/dehydratase family protein [Cryomorphaceae bacterium]